MMVLSSTDLVAALAAGTLLKMFEARKLLFIYATVSAVAGFGMLFLVDQENPTFIVPVLVAMARIGVASGFASLYMCHPLFFPTLFACTSMGISNFVCRIAVILAPMVAEMTFPTPIIVFTALQISAAIASLFIISPERIEVEEDEKKAE